MVFAKPIVWLYPATMAVRELSAAMLLVWAPFMLFDGLQLVFTYALRSLGDQVIAGLNSIIAFFFVTIALGSWLISRGMGAMALVWCIGISMLVCALLQGGRLVWFSSPRRLKSSG
jgi:MATE family multidrug resistance protein